MAQRLSGAATGPPLVSLIHRSPQDRKSAGRMRPGVEAVTARAVGGTTPGHRPYGLSPWGSGTGRRSSGTGRRSSGTGRRSSGTGRRSSGTGRRSSGTGRRSSGTGRRSSGTGRRSSGTRRRSSGTGRRSSGTGRRSSGAGRRSRATQARRVHGTGPQAGRHRPVGCMATEPVHYIAREPQARTEAGGQMSAEGSQPFWRQWQVGERVVVRYRIDDEHYTHSDALGELTRVDDEGGAVNTRRGPVSVPADRIAIGKKVPPPPQRRRQAPPDQPGH